MYSSHLYMYRNLLLIIFLLYVPCSGFAMGFADTQSHYYYNFYTSIYTSNGFGCDSCITVDTYGDTYEISVPQSWFFRYALVRDDNGWNIINTQTGLLIQRGMDKEVALAEWKSRGFKDPTIISHTQVDDYFWLRFNDGFLLYVWASFSIIWFPIVLILSLIGVYFWQMRPSIWKNFGIRFLILLAIFSLLVYIGLYCLAVFLS